MIDETPSPSPFASEQEPAAQELNGAMDAPSHASFLLKDVYDRGLQLAKRDFPLAGAWNPQQVLDAFRGLEEERDEQGKPNYDLYIWMALARLMVNTGDITVASTQVVVDLDEVEGSYSQWLFALPLSEELYEGLQADLAQVGIFRAGSEIAEEEAQSARSGLFLTLTRTPDEEDASVVLPHLDPNEVAALPFSFEEAEEDVRKDIDITWKAMGPIDINSYVAKIGSGYAMMVHPKLAQKAIGNIHFFLIQYLSLAGLLVKEHWIPSDTSRGFARYWLSDGITHYVLDLSGPILAVLLSHITQHYSLTEEEGGLVFIPGEPLTAVKPPQAFRSFEEAMGIVKAEGELDFNLSQDNPDLPA